MGRKTQTQKASDKIGPAPGLKLRVPAGARILIVCEDNSDTARLNEVLREEGFGLGMGKKHYGGL